MRKEIRCRHIGYSYRLTARVLLYAPSHRQDNTYHSLCYTSRGALAGMRNSSMGILDRCNLERKERMELFVAKYLQDFIRMLFYKTGYYNIHIFDNYLIKYMTRQIKITETRKVYIFIETVASLKSYLFLVGWKKYCGIMFCLTRMYVTVEGYREGHLNANTLYVSISYC